MKWVASQKPTSYGQYVSQQLVNEIGNVVAFITQNTHERTTYIGHLVFGHMSIPPTTSLPFLGTMRVHLGVFATLEKAQRAIMNCKRLYL